jgi:hypothetical protein
MIQSLNTPPPDADPVLPGDADAGILPAIPGTVEVATGEDYVSLSGSPASIVDLLQRLGWNYVGLD